MRQPEAPSRTMDRSADLVELEQLMAQFAELEAELQHIRSALTHSHRLATVGTLTSTIAHEYNNILTPVISYAQLALAQPDDSELMHKAVERALAGAQRAARISSSLLGFARDTADEGPADLARVVEEALTCLGRPPEKDGIRLELNVPNVRLAMGEVGLQQVLMNLILNARKAMRSKGGTLTIRGWVSGEALRLDVADTGPGIPPEVEANLFEPFVTAASASCPGNAGNGANGEAGDARAATEGAETGTGLGLAICRDLLRQAGGDISATSAPGEGATFHLTIPLADEAVHTT